MKTENHSLEMQNSLVTARLQIKQRSDRWVNYFLSGFFCTGFIWAAFYDTWWIAFLIGFICLVAYYSTKLLLPQSNLYQYVLSGVLGVFMAQYIYQMHGLLEMHFFAFIGSAILITYQNWKLQIPILVVVTVHHATLGYLQNIGVPDVFFTQLSYFELHVFIIHILLAAIIFFICGLWGYQLKKYTEIHIRTTIETEHFKKEAQLSEERKRNEEVLKAAYLQAEKARKEAEQASKAKSTFLATMSHEIRTPMNGVIGTTSLLLDTPLTTEQRKYTEIIRTSGDNLLSVINDILDFSKIESEKLELEHKPVDLRTCVEEVLDLFASKAAEKGLDLIYKMDYNVPAKVYGDSVRLKQVLQNLTSNAIKFTSCGEVFISVKLLQLNGENVEIEFEVKDTGIGIAEDKIGSLFQAFTQVDSSTTRKYGGTGLGLIISKRLTEIMGGTMYIKSVPGQGSSFHFSIQTQVSTEPVYTYIHTDISDLEGKRILIVDDNDTNLKILKDQLENWKFAVTETLTPANAIGLLNEQPFDLVITDMQMPVMDGIDLSLEIRKTKAPLPIILLSSLGDHKSKQHTELFCSTLTKPIKQNELYSAVITALKKEVASTKHEAASLSNIAVDFAKLHPMDVLVAEDNPVNQMLIQMIMKKLGYGIEIVSNGVKALEALDRKPYDLILMDVQMPEMDGLETTKCIRTGRQHQPVIIAVTANAMQDDRMDCFKAGMDDYISKPIKMDGLVKLLEKWARKINKKEAA